LPASRLESSTRECSREGTAKLAGTLRAKRAWIDPGFQETPWR